MVGNRAAGWYGDAADAHMHDGRTGNGTAGAGCGLFFRGLAALCGSRARIALMVPAVLGVQVVLRLPGVLVVLGVLGAHCTAGSTMAVKIYIFKNIERHRAGELWEVGSGGCFMGSAPAATV